LVFRVDSVVITDTAVSLMPSFCDLQEFLRFYRASDFALITLRCAFLFSLLKNNKTTNRKTLICKFCVSRCFVFTCPVFVFVLFFCCCWFLCFCVCMCLCVCVLAMCSVSVYLCLRVFSLTVHSCVCVDSCSYYNDLCTSAANNCSSLFSIVPVDAGEEESTG